MAPDLPSPTTTTATSSTTKNPTATTTENLSTSQSVTPVIVFLDVDSFECQIWQREQPHTRGMPCVVVNSCGRVLAATYEAKALGVSRSATPTLKAAMMKCRKLVVFHKPDKFWKQDQSKPRKATAELVTLILAFLKEYCVGDDIVFEVASSDEFYLDISAEVSRRMEKKDSRKTQQRVPGFKIQSNIVWERRTETKKGPFFYRLPVKAEMDHRGMVRNTRMYSYKNEERLMFGALFLGQLCRYLEKKTGLVMSGGVAKNKLLAKVGCQRNKPNKITVFYEEACSRVFKLVDLSSLPGLGGLNGEKLAETFGISKIGDILSIPYGELEEAFGKEKAALFTSGAMGQDVDPVKPRIFKEQIRCKKPCGFGDILTLRSLKTTLQNLTSEICMLVEEQESFYGRKPSQVKVEYKMGIQVGPLLDQNNNNMESHVFDIENFNHFDEIVLNYFCTLPTFSPDSCQITELAFVLKNFTAIMPSKLQNSPVCNSLENVSLERSMMPPPTLRIDTKVSDNVQLPQFKHSVVGGFRINSNLKCSMTNANVHTLINEAELQELVSYKLLRDFNPRVSCRMLLKDYNSYDELKHKFFSEWLSKNKLQNKELDDVKFVTFSGRLLRAYKTTLNKTFGKWETFGINVNGIIYLWDEKTSETKNKFKADVSYMGELFEQMVTGRKPKIPGCIDGINKIFPVQKVKLGCHNLLVLTDVDAQEQMEDGGFVQVQLRTDEKCFKFKNESFLLERNVKLFSQAVISDSKKVVIGYKDENNCVTQIDSISVNELSSSVENKETCAVFLDRLLEWMNAHLPNHNDKLVKKFSWIPGQIKVTCSVVPEKEVEKLLISRIYFPNK